MLTRNINFINFKIKKKNKLIRKKLKLILNNNNQVIQSLKKNYKNSYKKNIFHFFNKKLDFRIIGIGGSILGAKAIYEFLREKITKKFYFIDNLQAKKNINLIQILII